MANKNVPTTRVTPESMIGTRFGRLVVLARDVEKPARRSYVVVRCDCGAEKSVLFSSLRNGDTKSCGCLHSDVVAAMNGSHGMTLTKEYGTWRGMLGRCNNPNAAHYASYGGRGITVCERWLKFENFYADMGKKPDGLTLDRVDNNAGYSAENCRWASHTEQSRNTRAVMLDEAAVSLVRTLHKYGSRISQIASDLGVSYDSVKHVTRGKSWQDVPCMPV